MSQTQYRPQPDVPDPRPRPPRQWKQTTLRVAIWVLAVFLAIDVLLLALLRPCQGVQQAGSEVVRQPAVFLQPAALTGNSKSSKFASS
jgi:hypothetical protein